jgi:UDP-N-acetylglucosamine 4-epimerase
LLACSAPEEACGKAYNIAFGQQASIIGVYETLKVLLGGSGEPSFEPPRAGDVRDSLADISAARSALGYSPRYDIQAGLAKAAEWYRVHLK